MKEFKTDLPLYDDRIVKIPAVWWWRIIPLTKEAPIFDGIMLEHLTSKELVFMSKIIKKLKRKWIL